MKDYEQTRSRALHAAAGNFPRAMRMMREHDPQVAEDGFGLVRDIAAEHVQKMLDEFGRESDPGVRRWLLELIGQARSPQAFDVLAAELSSDDESLRDWAQRGLELLDTHEARRLLYPLHGRPVRRPPVSPAARKVGSNSDPASCHSASESRGRT